LVPPFLGIFAVFFLTPFANPEFKHTTNHKMMYALFMVVGIVIKGVAIFGVDNNQVSWRRWRGERRSSSSGDDRRIFLGYSMGPMQLL
jgi:hypothetical protein